MPVYNWTFDGRLRKHLIEIEHITSTGRLRLYLNAQLLLEEEAVKDRSWRHPFYIDGELLVAEVKWDGKYTYDFHEDEQLVSMRIRRSRRKTRLQIWKYMTMAALGVLLIGAVPYYLFNRTAWYRNIRLGRGEGLEVPATFYWDEVSGSAPKLTYIYHYRGDEFHGQIDTAVMMRFRTPAGMPVWSGDHFRVRLLTDHPASNVPDFSRVSTATMLRYRDRTVASINADPARLNFVNHPDGEYVRCVVEYVIEYYGIAGLAHIYFRHESGHTKGFDTLTKSSQYQRIQKDCSQPHSDSASSET